MVRSGLYQDPNASTVPRVSQYRLAAHLSSAVVLYTLFLWSGLSHILHPQQVIRFYYDDSYLNIINLLRLVIGSILYSGPQQICFLKVCFCLAKIKIF